MLFLLSQLQAATLAVTSSLDTFTSANNPSANYGAAGALNVSGSAAVNGSLAAQGLFDSFVIFNTAAITARTRLYNSSTLSSSL